MRKTILISLCCFFLIAGLAACAPYPSRLQLDYGTSFELQKFNQIADLEASRNLDPVEGMDGKAAEAKVQKYQKGFEKEPPAPVYSLSIGGLK